MRPRGLLLAAVLSALSIKRGASDEAQTLTDVCFNGCTGHGTCTNFVCSCDVGWFGDDCRHSFAASSGDAEGAIVPILGAGDYNLTAKNFSKAVQRKSHTLVGFSNHHCHKCIMHERVYAATHTKLQALGIPFARANSDLFRTQLQELNIHEMPALVLYKKGRANPYVWTHSTEAISAWVEKQLAPAVTPLASIEDVLTFTDQQPPESSLNDIAARGAPKESGPATEVTQSIETMPDGSISRQSDSQTAEKTRKRPFASRAKHPPGSCTVVGFFSDPEGIEEDEYQEFEEAVAGLQTRADVFVGAVSSSPVVSAFKGPRTYDWIDRSPAVVIHRLGRRKTLLLDEFYASGDSKEVSLSEWVVRESLPLVDHMTPRNFALYEKLGVPMLLLFLDLSKSHPPDAAGSIGGQSGGVSNNDLLVEFAAAAKEHVGRIAFVYVDGQKHADQMRAVGLFGGAERLPGVAFNTKDARQLPFSEKLPINRDTLLQFVASFLSGKLGSKADAEAAAKLALTNPGLNMKNLPTGRKPRKKAPPERKGVSEHFREEEEKGLVVKLSSKTIEAAVLDDTKDLVILFHAQGSEASAHMAVYFKRFVERLAALGISGTSSPSASVTVARMDVTNESPPPRLHFALKSLPALVLLPAHDRQPPYRYFSGVAKVLEMLKWVEAEATAKPIKLPPLAHLREEDVGEYKRQVAEREAARSAAARENEAKEKAEADRQAKAKKEREAKENKKEANSAGDVAEAALEQAKENAATKAKGT